MKKIVTFGELMLRLAPENCLRFVQKKLWSKEKAGQVMSKLCEYIDYCIANEEDAKDVFGIGRRSNETCRRRRKRQSAEIRGIK